MSDRGYLLPEEPYTDVLRWFLVAVPDKPEYVRAAMGAYTRFTKWFVWERTGDNSGALAADSWDIAVDATLEALEMGFPDILLGHIDEVEALLRVLKDAQLKQVCCDGLPGTDGLVGLNENDVETSDTDLANDIVPAPYVDAADYLANYHCRATVAWVDALIAWPTDSLNQAALGGSAVLVAILVYLGAALIVPAAAALLTIGVLLGIATQAAELLDLIASQQEVDQTAAQTLLQARRQDLICAVYTANDAEGAHAAVAAIVQEELSPGWYNFFLLWPHGSAIAAIFNGKSEAPNVPAGSCDCGLAPYPSQYRWDNIAPNIQDYKRQVGGSYTLGSLNITRGLEYETHSSGTAMDGLMSRASDGAQVEIVFSVASWPSWGTAALIQFFDIAGVKVWESANGVAPAADDITAHRYHIEDLAGDATPFRFTAM